MNDDEDRREEARGEPGAAPGDARPITPDEEPSALARGIRIVERLRRRR